MFAISLWNVQQDHVMTAIPGMFAWPSDTRRRLEVLGDNKVVTKSMPFLCVVWWINLCSGSWVVLSGRELMRMIDVGISFASQTKLRTHMLLG